MSSEQPKSEARNAGRGVLYIAFAKFYFMIAGAVIEFRLPAILSNTIFGAYAVVASTISPLNNVLVTGSIQAVSRFTSQRPELAKDIQRVGLKMHLFVGLPVALAFIGLAPFIASLLHDPEKTGPLMLGGAVIAGYSFYAVFVGTANGRRDFHKQAGLDICFATLRAIGILGLSMAGFGLFGALGGWVAAVAVILILASFVVGLPGRSRAPTADAADFAPARSMRPLLSFFGGVAVYLILLNFIMFIDQLLLKRLAAEWFVHHSTDLMHRLGDLVPNASRWADYQFDAAQAADAQVGYYRAVQNLARLSYQAIIAVTFVIFPLVSQSTFANDADATRGYISTTLRYSLVFATALGVVMAANPLTLLDIPYDTDYAVTGAPALIALALGNVAFSLFAIIGTILNGAGLTRPAILIASATLAVAAIANFIVIPLSPPGSDVLLAAASATGGAMLLGAIAGSVLLWKHLGAGVPLLTVARISLAVAAAMGVGYVLEMPSSLMTLVESAIVGLVFLAVLVITRELTAADWKRFSSVGRKKGKA